MTVRAYCNEVHHLLVARQGHEAVEAYLHPPPPEEVERAASRRARSLAILRGEVSCA